MVEDLLCYASERGSPSGGGYARRGSLISLGAKFAFFPARGYRGGSFYGGNAGGGFGVNAPYGGSAVGGGGGDGYGSNFGGGYGGSDNFAQGSSSSAGGFDDKFSRNEPLGNDTDHQLESAVDEQFGGSDNQFGGSENGRTEVGPDGFDQTDDVAKR